MQVYGSERCGSEIIWCHTKSRTEITDHHRPFSVKYLVMVQYVYYSLCDYLAVVFRVYAKADIQNGKQLKQPT